MRDSPGVQSGDADRELLRDMSERATLLYWNSDRSVNSIAEDLGLSKGRLYDLIQPLRSGGHCDICNSDLVFDNRTSRDRDEPTCPSCDGALLPERSRAKAELANARSSQAATAEGLSDPAAGGSSPPPLGLAGVIAGLLIGTVAGVFLGRVFRR
jgi:hypothetical protein